MSSTSFSVGRGEARAQRGEVVDGREVERVDAVGDDLRPWPRRRRRRRRRGRACSGCRRRRPRRGAPSSARRRGCSSAGACRPSPGGGRTRWRGRSSGTAAARRAPARRRRGATSQSWPWTTSKSCGRSSSAARPRACASFMPSTQAHELVEVARRRRLGHAVDAHAGADLLGHVALAPAREDVDRRRPCATSPSESLRTWRASPPSTIGGYSQERIRMRRGTSGA